MDRVMNMNPDYPERIVAFIDILGFENLIRRMETEPQLHKNILYALKQIKHIKTSSQKSDTAQSNLQVSVFSDSIVISSSINNLHDVLWTSVNLQCELLGIGVLVRGGISRGRTVHIDDILFGEGMLNAYQIESKAAVYPRIVLDPYLVSQIDSEYRVLFLKEDSDGLWFIDPFALGIVAGNADVWIEDGYDPYEESLAILGRIIDENIAREKSVAHISKWSWLKKQYTVARAELRQHGSPRFWKAFEKLYKTKR